MKIDNLHIIDDEEYQIRHIHQFLRKIPNGSRERTSPYKWIKTKQLKVDRGKRHGKNI
jgi:hypothetical protein